MQSPKTAAELNAWLRSHFNILEGSRAYIEFPVPFFDSTYVWRCTFKTIACAGLSEEKLVQRVMEGILAKLTVQELDDSGELLLVRRWFECDHMGVSEWSTWNFPPGTMELRGRLCFWRSDLNNALSPDKPEGCPPVFVE